MVIKKISAPDNASVGDAIMVTIALQRVQRVKSGTVDVPEAKTPVATPPKALGKKPTPAAGAGAAAVAESALHALAF